MHFQEDTNEGGFDDDVHWDEPETVMDVGSSLLYTRNPARRNAKNSRYNDAYGDYRGGYGPGGGFGPPRGGFNPSRGGFNPSRGGFNLSRGGFNLSRGGFNPRPPPLMGWTDTMWGPSGPPLRRRAMDERTIQYLARCNVPKEHLKNLPRSLLSLIEPQHCGLCDMHFESFAISRMHYISKNHLKNQKKWVSQNHQGSFLHHRETPLKARDLYCELCDVHITSKVHAESHYAGKPHRSIVEGRKNPKNPILLQRGMEQRLDQLIRREKRFLKPVEEEPPKEEETIDKEKMKSPPEFYCNICKTTMTCSEQMTMHLNGKKHLTKEKQHILKMMKGGTANASATSDDVAEHENDGNEEGGDDDADQEKDGTGEGNADVDDDGEKQGEGDQDFDWGAEGGQWEETVQEGDK